MAARLVPARTKWGVREMNEGADLRQLEAALRLSPAQAEAELNRTVLVDVLAMLDAGLTARARARLARRIEEIDRAAGRSDPLDRAARG